MVNDIGTVICTNELIDKSVPLLMISQQQRKYSLLFSTYSYHQMSSQRAFHMAAIIIVAPAGLKSVVSFPDPLPAAILFCREKWVWYLFALFLDLIRQLPESNQIADTGILMNMLRVVT